MSLRDADAMASWWRAQLTPDETLLWHGAPEPGLRVTWLMGALTLLGVLFLSGGILFVAAGLRHFWLAVTGWDATLGLFAAALGAIFAPVGAALTVGPGYAGVNAHRRLRYALSDHRAYILRRWWKERLESFDIGPDNHLELVPGKVDTVWFKTVESLDNEGTARIDRDGFQNIRDGDRVYGLLRKVQDGMA